MLYYMLSIIGHSQLPPGPWTRGGGPPCSAGGLSPQRTESEKLYIYIYRYNSKLYTILIILYYTIYIYIYIYILA